MPRNQTRSRTSTALVMLAVALQTLWPVVSTSNGVMEAFPHEEAAAEHDHADADANVAHEHESGDHHDGAGEKSHCDFCTSAAVGAVMPPTRVPAAGTPIKVSSSPPAFPHCQRRALLVHLPANPRAPPVYS